MGKIQLLHEMQQLSPRVERKCFKGKKTGETPVCRDRLEALSSSQNRSHHPHHLSHALSYGPHLGPDIHPFLILMKSFLFAIVRFLGAIFRVSLEILLFFLKLFLPQTCENIRRLLRR
jgi:hypothetical protein